MPRSFALIPEPNMTASCALRQAVDDRAIEEALFGGAIVEVEHRSLEGEARPEHVRE